VEGKERTEECNKILSGM